MTTQYNPVQWRDGPDGNTPLTAALENAREAALVGLCNDVADLSDGLGSATGGNNILRIVGSGPTSQRILYTPDLGNIYANTDRNVLEVGWGGSWRNPDGTLITATGGGSGGTGTGTGTTNAPTNMVGVVNTDNSIDLSWTAPVGVTVTSYKLYETRSPSGVSGATALTTTSSHRTPGSTGPYEYWVTALVAGVESAASNHTTNISLPYGSSSTGGGSTGGGAIDTPSEILRLGDEGGYWSLDVGYPSGNKSIDMDTINDGWSAVPYFTPVDSNTGVGFQVPMNGGTTSSNTQYPRVELRERKSDGSMASWNPKSGTHVLTGTTKVTHLPPNKPEVVVAQIHDADDDRLQLRVESANWVLSINGTDLSTPLMTGYSLGTYVSWSITVASGKVTVALNGSTKYNSTPSGWPSSGCYYKVGDYAQTNTSKGNSSSEYVGLSMQQNSLTLSHS